MNDRSLQHRDGAIRADARTPEGVEFEALLARARTGESRALEALVDRFYARVQADVHRRLSQDLRRGRRWLLARFSTGDVVHEVFESVIRDLDGFRGSSEDAFQGYLAVVIRNRILDAVRFHEAARRDGRRSVDADDGPELRAGTHHDPAVAAARSEEAERLEDGLADLDPRERHLVRARIEGVASFAELAEQLGYGSESAARRAYYSTLARLSVRLRPPGSDSRPEPDRE
ncbi:MAG: sigma-70 family RNA polymerase sigma factor [Planctomycetota bacterium]